MNACHVSVNWVISFNNFVTSRWILWLKANFTNSDPKVVGGYFLDTVAELQGAALTVRFDLGTENGVVERLQQSLRDLGERESSRPAFFYGTSPANQRIEAWWGQLRRHGAQFYMDFFKKLQEEEHAFNGSHVDKSLVQYCFLKYIQVCKSSARNRPICPHEKSRFK